MNNHGVWIKRENDNSPIMVVGGNTELLSEGEIMQLCADLILYSKTRDASLRMINYIVDFVEERVGNTQLDKGRGQSQTT